MTSGVSKKTKAKLNAMARAIKEREGRTVTKLFLDGVFYRVSPYHHWVTLKQYRLDCIEVQCKRGFINDTTHKRLYRKELKRVVPRCEKVKGR